MIQTIIYSLAAIGILALLFLIWKLPRRQANKYNIEPNKRWQVENEFRKTLIQVFGGLVVIVGLYFAYQEIRNFHISQENMKAGQIASRFSQTIKFLGEKNTTQNIGGIYALEQIAKESPENYLGTVIEVISAFVRNADVIYLKPNDFETWKTQYAPNDIEVYRLYDSKIKSKETDDYYRWIKNQDDKNKELKKFFEKFYIIKPETQVAMTVLGRIRTEKNKDIWENLPRINLANVNLRGADLREAGLTGADLTGADLREAGLTGADLTEANLMEADLKGAYLGYADLTRAYLNGAKLWEANLTDADLTEANLAGGYPIYTLIRDAEGLTVEQLLNVKSLWNVIGLPPDMEKELREKKPELFEEPK